MKNMQNNKSPGNDILWLTKEFYEGFWDEIKELLIVTEAKHRGELSISQRQPIIKLTKKKR